MSADIIDRLEKIHQLLQDEAAHVGEMLDTLRAELEASPERRLLSAPDSHMVMYRLGAVCVAVEVLAKLLAEKEEQ